MEIANAFSELNDPDEQEERFKVQERYSAEGDAEAQPYDEGFVRALQQGMPPAAGVGIGIDRLVMLLTGNDTIRDVVLFRRSASSNQRRFAPACRRSGRAGSTCVRLCRVRGRFVTHVRVAAAGGSTRVRWCRLRGRFVTHVRVASRPGTWRSGESPLRGGTRRRSSRTA